MAKNNKSGYGIIGLGRFGMALADMLAKAGEEVLVIDEDENNIRKIRDCVQEAFLIGRLTKEALEETGINECAIVIICISKVDVSVLTAQILLELGVPRVIGKADSTEHGMILEKIGADVVYPEIETATKLVSVLMNSKAIDLMRLNDNFVVAEIKISTRLRGCQVGKLHIERYNLKLIAIEEEPNKTIVDFDNDYKLLDDDAIVVVGKFVDAERFEREIMG